ncbi:hypothetical protein Acr_19g0007450 [Actinidia rufa]|uniref:RING-type domain-containing protein n=1 Tax=Actinidia rufa TaxID=165716 RepID=A0A7J0GAT5_9ERIC|nr:hypothetical protein Acr_19g0007450 [Actinidia rufa]
MPNSTIENSLWVLAGDRHETKFVFFWCVCELRLYGNGNRGLGDLAPCGYSCFGDDSCLCSWEERLGGVISTMEMLYLFKGIILVEVLQRMSQDEIRKLPCFDYEVGEKGKSSMECAVCLESFKVGDVCRLLPKCKHSFHVQCIDSWLLKTAVCPICRTGANFSPKIGGGQSSNSGGEVGVLELAANEQIQNLF